LEVQNEVEETRFKIKNRVLKSRKLKTVKIKGYERWL